MSRLQSRRARFWLAAALSVAAVGTAGVTAFLLFRGDGGGLPNAVRIERFADLLTGPGGAYMRTVGKPGEAVVDEWLDFKTASYKQNPDVESSSQLIIVSGPHGTSTYNPFGKLVETHASDREDEGFLIKMHEAAQAQTLTATRPIADSNGMTSVEVRDARKAQIPTLVVAVDDEGVPRKAQLRAGNKESGVYTIAKFRTLSRDEAKRQTRLGKLPTDTKRTVDRKITVDKLREYKGFKTYWLGERVPEGGATEIIYGEGTDDAPSMYVAYGTADDPYRIEINEWSEQSEEGKQFWSVTDGVTRTTVKGHPAKMVKEMGELVIKVDETVVDISGADAEDLLQLARKQLRRP